MDNDTSKFTDSRQVQKSVSGTQLEKRRCTEEMRVLEQRVHELEEAILKGIEERKKEKEKETRLEEH